MFPGVLASIFASMLFAGMFYLAPSLAPLQGEEIYAWRILFSLPFTTALLLIRGMWPDLIGLLRHFRQQPKWIPLLLFNTALLAIQLWLFVWAPLHGRALSVSLGYFLLPLAMVVAGRLFYHDHLSPKQCVAVFLAALGVAWEFLQAHSLSWEVLLVTVGYTLYFLLRRHLKTEGLAGHWLDLILMLPAALYFIHTSPTSLSNLLASHPKLFALLPLLGLVSSSGLVLYMMAHRLLPLSLFGMLSYVEPILLALVALLLGERLLVSQWPTYGLIFAAVVVLALDGLTHRQR